MLSRRNVRIKVMQILYALGRDKNLKLEEALQRYREKVSKSFELYLLNLEYFIQLCAYALQDEQLKKSKLRPTQEDKLFSARLATNPLTGSLRNNEGLKKLFRYYQVSDRIDAENIRRFYYDFAKGEAYKKYLELPDPTSSDHEHILLELYRFCLAQEEFDELMEDAYAQWIDDKSLITGAMKKTLKALPAPSDFFEPYRPNDETTVDYGEVLLKKVFLEDEALLQVIEPTLKNWDAERVAIIDMILLKMALAELITFPSIPTKVTLNEFVEIAKTYSTDKSKDFINGILDRLMKQLVIEGKIKKDGRGLQE